MSLSVNAAEEQLKEIAVLVDLYKRHPAMEAKSVLGLLKDILYNGFAKPWPAQSTNPVTQAKVMLQHTGAGYPKVFNKSYEFIGQKAGNYHSKFEDNPFGIVVGIFERCQHVDKKTGKVCNLVGITGITVNAVNKSGSHDRPHTYVYKSWLHENNQYHYESLFTQDNVRLSWPEIVKRYLKLKEDKK